MRALRAGRECSALAGLLGRASSPGTANSSTASTASWRRTAACPGTIQAAIPAPPCSVALLRVSYESRRPRGLRLHPLRCGPQPGVVSGERQRGTRAVCHASPRPATQLVPSSSPVPFAAAATPTFRAASVCLRQRCMRENIGVPPPPPAHPAAGRLGSTCHSKQRTCCLSFLVLPVFFFLS